MTKYKKTLVKPESFNININEVTEVLLVAVDLLEPAYFVPLELGCYS